MQRASIVGHVGISIAPLCLFDFSSWVGWLELHSIPKWCALSTHFYRRSVAYLGKKKLGMLNIKDTRSTPPFFNLLPLQASIYARKRPIQLAVWSFSAPKGIKFGLFISWSPLNRWNLHQRCLGKLVRSNSIDIIEFPMPCNPNLYSLSHHHLLSPSLARPMSLPSGCIARPWASLLPFIVTDIIVLPNHLIV